MNNLIKEMVAYGLLCAVSVFLLFLFALIARYGEVAVYEPNKIILISEIAICAGMLVFSIERLRNFEKRLKK